MRHVPYWFDRFPKTRRPSYPRLRGAHEARVAIVGGGLTGCAIALAFATAGINVVLVEADAIGAGATAGSNGVLREGFSGSFRELASRHGLRTTRALWEGIRRGSLDFAAAVRRLKIKCDLAPMDVLTIASRSDDGGRQLKREQLARREGGADAVWMNAAAAMRDAGVEAIGAIRTRAMVIDPYRACLGVAAAAAARGARIHERSRVTRIKPGRRHVDIILDGGTLCADSVIVATASPISDLRALRRHVSPTAVYGVVTEALPAAVRKQVGRRTTIVEDFVEPHRLVRWLPDDRVLVSGARQPQVAERLRERALSQRAGQLMYEFSLLYPPISGLQAAGAWDTTDYETVDGLPFIGAHRNFPRHLFAYTPSRHGAGLAWTAARLLLRRHQQEASRADDAFGFARIL
jgi:glycine/D-amino acid oxidase-like deaminating enzyme